MTMQPIIAARQISKQYAGTRALDGVDFEINPGEVLGLIGENGAGKSTLMRIISGIEQPSDGELSVNGAPTVFAGPQAAQAQGIAMIPQEVMLVDDLTVTENIFLGHEPTSRIGTLPKSRMRAAAVDILKTLDSERIDPDQPTGSLPKGMQQIVAIARRVIQGGSVFVMDEPTASLTGEETQSLFRLLRRLKSEGKSSVFISHRLEEMLDICDRIVVLRDGALVGNYPNDGSLTKDKLVAAMVGSVIAEEFSRKVSDVGSVMLELDGVEITTFQGRKTPPISLAAHAGEVVGVTGLAGIGKTEMAHLLSGLRAPLAGQIRLKSKPIKLHSPVDGLKNRIGLVSEDRRAEGLVLGLSALANMTLTSLRRLMGSHRINAAKERDVGLGMVDNLSMRPEYLSREANLLSGGNQQKVVIIRQLCAETEVLLLDEPTKGIDIGAKAEVYRLIGDFVAEDKTAVLFSSEPQEVLGVCDKIYVLTADGFLGPYPKGTLDYAGLMALEFGTAQSPGLEATS
ncbi:MAG: sugar ABC transporter ATP-binding protein [Sedimentitalea sp.]|uniref:sugar ABC transporter ATP-binding protein n=1 Tax=Sedimentitalea sp. TaxID=2048915 RepID=UPI003263F442